MNLKYKNIVNFVGLGIFFLAAWILHHELKQYHYKDIVTAVEQIPFKNILYALFFTIVNYIVIAGYDFLALRYINRPLKFKDIFLAAFLSTALSNNAGYSVFSAGAIRYRLYSVWDISIFDITKITLFSSITLWIGLFTVCGLVFLFEPVNIPAALHLPFTSSYFLGLFFLSVAIAYLLIGSIFKKSIKIWKWTVTLPSFKIISGQILISSLDWIIAGTVLYFLLPAGYISFYHFLGIFLFAQLLGIISQVPGGLGVFETAILLLLPTSVKTPQIFGSLLAFRATYYIFPLVTALIILGIHELLAVKKKFIFLTKIFGKWIPELAPRLLTISTFISGVILLFSGATPAEKYRLLFLKKVLPLPVMEISHFLGSIIGIALLFLARGLQLRIDVAYFSTLILLSGGIVFSLLKGFDYEEAVILMIMIIALIPSHKYFYRKASVLKERLSAGWILAIGLVLVSSIWLGMFAYKHIEYSNDLWWHMSFFADAPRFMRASVGVFTFIFLFSIARVLQVPKAKLSIMNINDIDAITAIVKNSPYAYANLALTGDKRFILSENKNACIMYGIKGKSCISMGDPLGPESERNELLWNFREFSDKYAYEAVFYEISHDQLFRYIDIGLTFFKMGEEAFVSVQDFSLEGSSRKSMRSSKNRLEREGYTFEIVEPSKMPDLFPRLKIVSDNWLKNKSTKEKSFSLGYFDESYLKNFPIAIIHKDNKIAAFANIWTGAQKEEFSIDLMRHDTDAPNGVMDNLIINTILWGKEQGYKWFNLGMVPMSGLESRSLAPLWGKAGAFLFSYGEYFYNFQGLKQYKEKFDPVWKPKYVAYSGGLALFRVLVDISSLISGGVKGLVTK